MIMKIGMEDISSDLMTKFWYLATPYTKYEEGHEKAFNHACQVTGTLLMYGMKKVFSPIAHSHPVAYHSFINPTNNLIWLDPDGLLCHMMDVCDGMLIAPLPGWEYSYGINFEIDQFQRQDKPIFLLPKHFLPRDVWENADVD